MKPLGAALLATLAASVAVVAADERGIRGGARRLDLNEIEIDEDAPVASEAGGKPTGGVIVGFKPRGKIAASGASAEAARANIELAMRAHPVVFESKGKGDAVGDFEVREVGPGNEEAFMKDLEALDTAGIIEYMEVDTWEFPDIHTDDTFLSYQYHHPLMGSFDAWDIETGSADVTVAICDSGVQLDHPDLEASRLEGYSATTQTWESDGGDVSANGSHGTKCAGCAAAIGNNGRGMAGVGWNFKHRPGRVSDGPRGGAKSSVLADCARTMCALPDVKVVSVSYSGVTGASRRSAATYCKIQGALMVNSAGNDSRNLTSFGDADADDLIVAGASDRNDNKAGFSAYGRFVDVWAPGRSVYTTTTGGRYQSASGTSFSCPLVAGLVALIWSRNTGLTPDEVEGILKASTEDVGLQGRWDTNYGRISSRRAMEMTHARPTANPSSQPTGAPISTPNPTSTPTSPPSNMPSAPPTNQPTTASPSNPPTPPPVDPPTPPPVDCTQCTDDASPWMINNNKQCATSPDLMQNYCKDSPWWTASNFCQQSCFEAGQGYAGDNCCMSNPPTAPPTNPPTPPPVDCTQCTDDASPWMINNNKQCATSLDLMQNFCKDSAWWTASNFCQQSCFEAGQGYAGDNCCMSNPPTPPPADPPTPPPIDCTQCTDDASPWMIDNNRQCATSLDLMQNYCKDSAWWTASNFCQQSCFDNDRGYPGPPCCDV